MSCIIGIACANEPSARLEVAPSESRSNAPDGPRVVFLGDSLTAGYGLPADRAWPQIVGEILAGEGVPIRVVNAGVSGDTSAGGVRRIDWLLKQDPAIVIVGLGANDGLRGLSPDQTHDNLTQIVRRTQGVGARVLLLGMKMPPSLGPDYAARFGAVFPDVAQSTGVALVPFLLEGVGGDPALNLPDGIHPNADGQERVARNVLPYLRKLLDGQPSTPG